MRNRSAFGWGELVVGIALVVLGIFTFARPSSALTGIVFVYGLLAVVTGIADIAFYVKIERHTGFGPVVSLITGILSILAGVLCRSSNPGAVKWAMALLFPALVHHALHLAPDPSAGHPADGRVGVLLLHADRQHSRPDSGFRHDREPGAFPLLGQLRDRHLPAAGRDRPSRTGGEQHWKTRMK